MVDVFRRRRAGFRAPARRGQGVERATATHLNADCYWIAYGHVGRTRAEIQSECAHRAVETWRDIFFGQRKRLQGFRFRGQGDLFLFPTS